MEEMFSQPESRLSTLRATREPMRGEAPTKARPPSGAKFADAFPTMPKPTRLRLVYFPVRAKAEMLRMALIFGKVAFEDIGPSDYFGKGWRDGAKQLCPFGQLPLLVVDDEPPIAQSGAIMRYICRSLVPSLTPTDAFQAAQCDALFEASQELTVSPTNVNPLVNVFRGDDFAEKKKTYFEIAPPKIANLAKLCKGPFFLGETPFYADLAIFHVLSNTCLLEPTALDDHPKLQAFCAKVAALPGVAEYLDERPDAVDIGVKPMLQPKKRARDE